MSAFFDIYQSPPQKDGRISLHPRLVEPNHLASYEMMDDGEHSSTLTRADLHAAMESVSHYLAEKLGRGGCVHLEGIGSFSVVPHFKSPKFAGDKISGKDVAFRRIKFTPERQLKARVAHTLNFERRSGRHSGECDSEKARELLQEYFKTHDYVSKREFQQLSLTCEYRARLLLTALMEEGFVTRRRIGSAYLYSLGEERE